MIKFFRKIRQNLLMENKTAKYFKYAIGEIFLVVIGILIAVVINSKYQEAENQKKVTAILVQIQQELLTDIIDAERIFQTLYEKNEYKNKIFSNTLTLEDLSSANLYRLTTFYVSFSTNKTAYQRLINNLEILPNRYESLLPNLNYLYVEMQNDIDDYNEQIKKITYQLMAERSQTIPQFSHWLHTNNFTALNTYLTKDRYYQNKILAYLDHFLNITQASSDYKIKAIKTYLQIDSLLQKENNTPPQVLKTMNENTIDLESYYGNYVNTNKDTLSLSRNGNQLQLKEKGITTPLWLHKDAIYFTAALDRTIELVEHTNKEKSINDFTGLVDIRYTKVKE